MFPRLAQQIRAQREELVDLYDDHLCLIPGYANLPQAARQSLERQVLDLMAEAVETADDSVLIQYIHDRARQVLTLGFKSEWFQEAVAVPEKIVTPLVETVPESHFVWRSLNRAQNAAWQVLAEERRRVEAELHESEEQYRNAIVAAGAVPYYIDYQTESYRFIGKAIESITGYSPHEITPTLLGQLIQETVMTGRDSNLSRAEAIQKARSGDSAEWKADYRLVDRFGQTHWLSDASVQVLDADSKPIGAMGILQDITERMRAEQTIRDNETRQRNILNALPLGIHLYEASPDGELIFIGANTTADKLLGVDNSIFVGKSIDEAFPLLEQTETPQRYREAALQGVPWQTQQISYHDGRIRGAFEVHAFQTEPGRMAAAFLDVSERLRAEEALRQYAAIVESTAEAIFSARPDGTILSWNPASERMLGYTAAEIIGQSVRVLAPPDRLAEAKEIMGRLAKGEHVQSLETVRLAKNGERIEVSLTASPILDEAGKVVALSAMLTDITQRKRAEEAVLRERNFSDAMVNSLSGVFYLRDPQGHLVRWNKNLETVTEYTAEELVQQGALDLIAEQDRPAVFREMQEIYAGGEAQIDVNIVTKGGRQIPYHLTGSSVNIEDQVYLMGVGMDISERKRLEREIQESLARRGFQVQTSTEVAQEIAAAPALDELFNRVVTLIKERFGYYHTQIFRYEPAQDAMVLVSGYGEAGQKMLAARHKLIRGHGMVGVAATTGQSILASDVTQDKDWRPNPNLPNTKSELAVPIKLRDQILGVLDVQSDRIGALTVEDQLLLEGLCGQIASAMESTRLLEEGQRTQNLLDSLIENLPIMVFAKEAKDLRFVRWNKAAEEITGFYDEEMIGKNDYDFFPKEEADAFVAKDREVLEGDVMVDIAEEPLQSRHQGLRWLHTRKIPLRDEQGNPQYLLGISEDITDRKRATDALAAERNLIRTLIDTIPDLIYAKDVESRFILANMSTAQQMGAATADDLLGKSDLDFYPRDLAVQYLASERPIVQDGQAIVGIEEPTVDASGQARWQTTTKVPLRDAAGNVIGLVGITSDITARKQVEEELRGTQRFLDSVLENLPIMVFVKEAQNLRFVRWNKTGEELVGFSHEEMLGKNDYDFFPKDEADHFVAKDREVLNGKVLVDTPEEPIQTRHRGLRLLHTRKIPILDAQGNPQYLLGISEDITDRKRAEEELTRSAQLLRTLMQTVPDYFYIKNAQSEFVLANQALANVLNLASPDELIGKTDFDFFPRELAEKFYQDEQAIIQSGQPLMGVEEPSQSAEGKRLWVSTSKVPFRGATGEVEGIIGLGRDITERKEAEAELERLLADQQKRTLQLQTAAEVSRAASSILNVDELLPQAADLILARFDLYYVGIFLIDEARQWAVLRAGTGSAGAEMLSAGHRLRIGGTSMISRCITQQEAQIALDVGEAAVRFDNPLLPLTHSEMALPLISRGQPKGAITIQSERVAAFTADDITVLQTMADQISNAIDNAALYEQAQAALREVDTINRRLTGDTWDTYLRGQGDQAVISAADDAEAAPDLLNAPDLLSAEALFTTGEVVLEPDPDDRSEATVTAPILLRGQPIGALRMKTTTDDWNQDLEAVLTDIAGHVAQAVENARLIEQTQRTASRERAINEINARVRQNIDLDSILRTAVTELGQTLKAARVVARVGAVAPAVTPGEKPPTDGGVQATPGNGRGEKHD